MMVRELSAGMDSRKAIYTFPRASSVSGYMTQRPTGCPKAVATA